MNIITNEIWFLMILGLIWIISAVLQDIKRREVDNIWNFSLIFFALAYRAFLSIFLWDYRFFVTGLIGFGFFYIIANLFYFSKMFAGGDAKLLMALGPVLPLSLSWLVNLKIFGAFIILFLIAGSIYALIYSLTLVLINIRAFAKEFDKQYHRYKRFFWLPIILALLWTIFVLIIGEKTFIFISIIIVLSPLLFIFSKAVEESCMIKKIQANQVTEGDWLYKDILVSGKKIKSTWEGISKKELLKIRKSKKPVLIKQGIPFTPSFLIAYIILLFLFKEYSWIFFFDIFA